MGIGADCFLHKEFDDVSPQTETTQDIQDKILVQGGRDNPPMGV